MEFEIRKIHFAPDRWPIHQPPEAVYAQGSSRAFHLLRQLPQRGLAVVGTRRPQPRAEILTRNTIAELAESGLTILSGLAIGIDACAHEAALDARLPTIAILGCGIHLQYPPENAVLRQRILENDGLVISEYEPDQEARPHFFLKRNRLIAGFARAIWIVQAPARSGALNTATYARDEHHDCYATPSFPGDPALIGTQGLLDDGHAIALWGAHSLGKTWLELSSAGRGGARRKKALGSVPSGSAEQDPVFQQIHCRTAQSGGITLEDLLDWAMSQGIAPTECFERLQKALQCGRVSEQTGVYAANQISP